LFQAQVARTPEATAVVFEGSELSYAQLNRRATRLARYLVSLGAGPERLVAVPQSLEMVAVVKSGAAYLPVDPGYPAERVAFMLGDGDPVAVITSSAVEAGRPAVVPQVVLDDPGVAAAVRALGDGDLADAERREPLRLGHPVYVMFTSGSTGRPKGVVVSHGGLADLLSWLPEDFPAGEFSRVLGATSLSFDVSVFEIFGTLAAGGCVETVANVLVRAERPWAGSMISAVPSAIAQVLSTSGVQARAEVVVLGGEAISVQVAADIRAALPGVRIVNIYGPTEAKVYVTSWGTGGEVAAVPPIGRPIGNTRVFVLDEGLRLAPVGVAGEL
jgi:non-ribosomal peptide synthetase component F